MRRPVSFCGGATRDAEADRRRVLRGVDCRNAAQRLGIAGPDTNGAGTLFVDSPRPDRHHWICHPWHTRRDVAHQKWALLPCRHCGPGRVLVVHAREGGRHRRIGKVAIALIWLACSAYVMEFLSWSA